MLAHSVPVDDLRQIMIDIVDGTSDGGDTFERDGSGEIIGGDRLPIIVNANRKGAEEAAAEAAPPSGRTQRTPSRGRGGATATAVLDRTDAEPDAADDDSESRTIPAARRPRRTAAESEAAAKRPATTKKSARRTKRRPSGHDDE
jgi:hypothetical protein